MIFCTVYPVKLSRSAILCHNSNLFKMSLKRIYKNFQPRKLPEVEFRSFGPSNKSKIKQKTPPTNLQWLLEVACMQEFYH